MDPKLLSNISVTKNNDNNIPNVTQRRYKEL